METTIVLNDGANMPRLGIGTWQMTDAEAAKSVGTALDDGYRLIDTAAIYENEAGVGKGLKAAKVKRDDLFVTTKLWNNRHGSAPAALKESLGKLGLDYVDLYLIHWPSPGQDQFATAWSSLIELRSAGLTRSIGVSNFNIDHLERIIAATKVVPALNQIELHPGLQQTSLRAFHEKHRIVTQAWSPLGRGAATRDRTIGSIANRLRRTPAQVILRWQLQLGLSTIPKSVTPARIRENFALYDFDLTPGDMKSLASLDAGTRLGPDPAAFE